MPLPDPRLDELLAGGAPRLEPLLRWLGEASPLPSPDGEARRTSRLRRLHTALADRGLLASSLVAERVGWPEQRLLAAAELNDSELPYFSLLLVRQGWPPVLP